MPERTRTTGKLPSKISREREAVQFMLLDQQVMINGLPHSSSLLAAGDVDTSNRRLVELLDGLRLEVQQHGIDLTNHQSIVDDFFEKLGEAGAAAFSKFLPETAQQQMIALEQQHEQGMSLNFLEMAADPRSFLWELLYPGDPLDDIDPLKFWGFRYRNGRTYMGLQWNTFFHLRNGVFSAIHDGLELSKLEVENLEIFIAAVCKHLKQDHITLQRLDHHLPSDAVSVNKFIKLLIADHFTYGLVHFACHCENPAEGGVDQACLSLTVHGQTIEISLERLIGLKGKHKFAEHPFFFLNACESATPGYIMHKLGFPTGILSLGASGVIATTCIMPDNFASAFATEFYRRLLNKPSATDSIFIGEALLETRVHFLQEYNNPLGLAYGLYAVSDQQLRLVD